MQRLPVIVLFLLVAFLTLAPVLFLLGQSWGNYQKLVLTAEISQLVANTLVFATCSTLMALTLGTLLAWLCERTNMPWRSFVVTTVLLPLLIPEILMSVSWVFLLSPKIGFLNQGLMTILGLTKAPFNIYSLAGMVWVEGLSSTPLAFILMQSYFRSLNGTMEEMALVCGATQWETFLQITLKLASPALWAAGLLIFIKGLAEFDVPSVIGLTAGIKVLTTEVFLSLRTYPTDYGLASAYAVLLLLLLFCGLSWQTRMVRRKELYATITGKDYRLNRINLGWQRILAILLVLVYLITAVLLPWLMLFWSSFQPYYQPPGKTAIGMVTLANYRHVFHYDHFLKSIRLTLELATSAASIIILFSLFIAWLVIKSSLPGRSSLDKLASLPLVFPGIILGTGILLLYLNLPLPVYGTTLLLLIGYVTQGLPYGVRYISTALLQVHTELEEMALICGANRWEQFIRITLPLLKPGIICGWIYLVVLSIRHFSLPLLLSSPGCEVLSVTFWELWSNGGYVVLSAIGTILIGALVLLGSVGWFLHKTITREGNYNVRSY